MAPTPRFAQDQRFRRDLAATVVVTLLSTAIVLVLAWVIALYLRLTDSRMAKVLSALAVVPMFIPVVIASWAILNFYASDGFLRTLGDLAGIQAPTWGYTLVVRRHRPGLDPPAVRDADGGRRACRASRTRCSRPSADAGASMLRTDPIGDAAAGGGPHGDRRRPSRRSAPRARSPCPTSPDPTRRSMLGVDMSNFFTSFNRPQQSVVMAVRRLPDRSGLRRGLRLGQLPDRRTHRAGI